MKYGSVCSGIEAATAAWHPLGWNPAWFAEIEAFPSRVPAHHYPGVRNYGDFTKIPSTAEPIDLLVGGTPCQSFSIAGLRGGLGDERGNLALEYCRLAMRLRPRWTVWENVPGVLSSSGGRDFGSILGALAQLGYGLAYRVLDAQYYGVPQRRRRVFVVGYLGDWRRAAAVLFEPESLCGNPSAGDKARQAAARSPQGSTSSGRRAGTIGANYDRSTVQDALAGNFVPTTAGTLGGGSGSRGWSSDTERMTFIPQTVGALTARYTRHGHGASGVNIQDVNSGHILGFHLTQDPISGPVRPALSAGNERGCASLGVLTCGRNAGVRRLTPTECERLQGFPDGYTAIPGAADGPRYRVLGNSMAVPSTRWIGERIERVESITRGR